jgi:type II secretory pathway component PulF
MNTTQKSLLMLCFGVFVGVAVAIGVFFIVPNFQEVFNGFGMELPLTTKHC